MGVLAIAAILRVILVFRGGQFSQLDENRYDDSRQAALEIARGHLLRGITLPLEKGDHVGYKVLGVIPALVEHATGGDRAWIPGLFFGAFSLLSIALLGGIAWRLSGSRRAQFWAVLAAACSGSLFYFSRHLLPYDASMCFILLGLFLAVGPHPRWLAVLFAGAFVGLGFVTYYGHWTLGGFALGMAAVCGTYGSRSGYWPGLLMRGMLLGTGLAAAVALPVIVNCAWGSGLLVQGARNLSGSIITGDFRGHLVPWEYLWYTDYLELPIAVGFAAWGALAAWRSGAGPRSGRWRRPETVTFACFLGIYVMFIVTGTLMHKFAVHDRLIRQLLPFMVLGFAFGVEAWLAGERDARAAALRARVLSFALAANAAFAFATPLSQEWPGDFKRRADAILARRSDPVSADSYFRYVNVLEYYYEPEVLKVRPLETLLAAPHFFQYRPYLYEAKTPEDRARRESVDSSMRLVKVPILPASRIRGDSYGTVTLHIRLPRGRLSYLEPLLSLGPPGDGDVLFIRYYSDSSIALGFFSWGEVVYEADRVEVEPGSEHEVKLLCGDLVPGNRGRAYDELRKRVVITFDGRTVLDRTAIPKDFPSGQVYAGVNAVMESYTAADFSGKILSAVRDDDLSQYLPGQPIRP
jgi:hypothetical protein